MKNLRNLFIVFVLILVCYGNSVAASKKISPNISLVIRPNPTYLFDGFPYLSNEFPRNYLNKNESFNIVISHKTLEELGLGPNDERQYKFEVYDEKKRLVDEQITSFQGGDGNINGYTSNPFYPNNWGFENAKKLTIKGSLILDSKYSKEINLYINENNSDIYVPWAYSNLVLSQKNPQWEDIEIGDCTDGTTIGDFGCATTAKAFIFNYFALDKQALYYPDDLNDCLNNNSGYEYCYGCYSCLIGQDTSPPICGPNNVIFQSYYESFDKDFILAKLDDGNLILAKTKTKGSDFPMHFVVIIGEQENGRFNIFDPVDGHIRHLEDSPARIQRIEGIYLYKSLPN